MPRPAFTTARLRLRPLEPRDAKALHVCFGDPEAMRFWDSAPSRDVAQTKARIGRNTTRHAAWAILSSDGKRFLGMINYHQRQVWNRRLEVGYILARPHWRQGFMHEAMVTFLDYCFGALESHRVEAIIEPENAASRGLVEKLGFQAEGLMRDRLCVGGAYRSVIMYALLAEDWRARHPKPPAARAAKRRP
ncbi:MAG TPA: GNAT family protein [Alphaproteobacteria bacterium]